MGILVGALFLVGCRGSEEPDPAATGTDAEATEPTEPTEGATASGADSDCGTGELTLMPTPTPNAPISFYQDAARTFEGLHDGITVEVQEAPGPVGPYLQQLAATGDFPDVFLGINPDSFPGENPLQPIAIEGDIAELPKVEEQTQGGELYTIPGYILPSGLVFYNTEVFEEVGITSAPQTLEEFEAAMAQLADAGHVPMIMGGDWSLRVGYLELTMPNVFDDNVQWYADRHAGEVAFAAGDWLEFTQRFEEWADAGYIHPGSLDLDYTGAQQTFLAGDAAMYPMASYFTRSAGVGDNFEAGVFQTPTEDGDRVIATNYVGWSVAKDSEHPEAAMCLASYLSMDRDFQADMIEAEGWFSNLPDPVEVDRNPLEDEIFEFVADSQHVPGENGWGDNTGPGAFRAELEPALQALLGDSKSAEEAMADVDAAWDSAE